MSENRIEEFLLHETKAKSHFGHATFLDSILADDCSSGPSQHNVVEGWEEAARMLFNRVASSIAEKSTLILKLRELECRIAEIESRGNSKSSEVYSTFITTLGINGIDLKKPIPVTIRSAANEVIASFLDANISTGGKTLQEAISDLQSLIADSFERLESTSDSTLGPAMTRRKKALLETVCRI